MSLLDLLLHPGMRPFEIAIGLVVGLLILEVVMNQLGFSIFGEMDADTDVELDIDVSVDASMTAELDSAGDVGTNEIAAGGFLSWLGFGKVPAIIWLSGVLTGFGLSGYVLQLVAIAIIGAPMSAGIASFTAIVPGVLFGSRMAGVIGRLFPKHYSTSISRRSYGRRRGVITVGTARIGQPAQARFFDRHGNMHFAMVEPFEANDPLEQGTEVRIIRTRDGALKAVRLTN